MSQLQGQNAGFIFLVRMNTNFIPGCKKIVLVIFLQKRLNMRGQKMLENKTFNAYMLKTFDECQQKFNLLYNMDIRLPSNTSKTLVGDKIHILVNYYLNGKNTSKFEKILSQEELHIFENFKSLEILNTKCWASEYPFSVKLSDYYLTGRVDAVFQNEGKIIIADWKTGKKQDGVDYQSMIYLFAFYEIFKHKKMNISPENFEFVYFYLGSGEKMVIK